MIKKRFVSLPIKLSFLLHFLIKIEEPLAQAADFYLSRHWQGFHLR